MRATLTLVGALLLAVGLFATGYCDAQTTLYPEADSEVRSGAYADTNYGSSSTLYVREQTSNTCNRAVFRFDLSSISGTVTDAKLKPPPPLHEQRQLGGVDHHLEQLPELEQHVHDLVGHDLGR